MWRSIALRSRHVARSFSAIQASKVQSPSLTPSQSQSPPQFSTSVLYRHPLYQNPRFFSQSSANPDEESSISSVTELCSVESSENGGAQMVDSAPNSHIHAELDQSNVGFAESGEFHIDGSAPGAMDAADSQMDAFAPGDEKNEPSEETSESFGEDDNVLIDNLKELVYEVDVEKLKAVLFLLQSSADGSLESSLDEFDLVLHQDFVVRVLESPHILGANLIRFFKWVMKNQGFRVTTSVMEALVLTICSGDTKKKDAYSLWDLVKEIGGKEKGILNVEILNELIAVFSKLGKGKAALEVFDNFGDFGVSPNSKTYYFTIEALCRRSFMDWAWSVCEKMLNAGMLPETEQVGKILSWLCKEGKAKEAHSVYMLAKEKSKYPPRLPVCALINSLCANDETVTLALEMLGDFSGEARKHAIKPFSDVIRGLCRMKNVNEAKTLLLDMISTGPPPGNAVFNSVINSYSKSGDLNEAKEMIGLMETRGLKPDVYTYTVVISGYAKGGLMEEACGVLAEAKKKHAKLSPVTYHTLIRGYCKIEEYDKALKLLSEMEGFGVQPNADEYGKLIQSLCLKALDWGTAEKLFEEMKEKGLHLNVITRGLIRAVKELETEAVDNGNENLMTEA